MSTHPSPATQPKLYIFECNSETYLTCMEKGLFGSNKNWPLAVKKGDFCLLHHLEAGTLLGLWKTASDGGRHLDARAWKGKFPYQVKVMQASAKIDELAKAFIAEFQADPVVGRFDPVVEGELAAKIMAALQSLQVPPP
ncbi:MAG: hypothetical protein DWH82_09870 [Planctomycetota bacterium]|nr:MAG: hypothetical protein DWH82_09870 [Planctomycetota bacterium]